MRRRAKVNLNSSGPAHLSSRTGEREKGSANEMGIRAIKYKREYFERETFIS